jgi:isoamylase
VNNNAYCQDNELSWYDWSEVDENIALLGWTRRLMDFRRRHPVFHRRKWFRGRAIRGSDATDIAWFNPDGGEMTEEQWNQGFAKSIGVLLNGDELPDPGPRGEKIHDDTFLLLFNAHHEQLSFALPTAAWGDEWVAIIDTAEPLLEEGSRVYKAAEECPLTARSVAVLQARAVG